MLKLLIADSSENICDSLRSLLENDFETYCCTRGNDFSALFWELKPELVILDPMLPGGDPVGVLQAAGAAGIHPQILAMTNCTTDYVVGALTQVGVGYIMAKPCSISAVAARITDMAIQMSQKDEPQPLAGQLHMVLHSLSFSRKSGGYRCLVTALECFYHDPDMKMYQLYPVLQERYGCAQTGMEKAMRDCIQSAWKIRNEAVWRIYLPAGESGKVPCPTLRQFLQCVGGCLRSAAEKRA